MEFKYFKKYFPIQSWAKIKIEELYKVGCLIAYNSYEGNYERELVSFHNKQLIK